VLTDADMRERVGAVSRLLQQEDGVAQGVGFVRKHLS
jgi:hypothetical protein